LAVPNRHKPSVIFDGYCVMPDLQAYPLRGIAA
jgi:hypothetical protein